jgi:CspA family cold shock protein
LASKIKKENNKKPEIKTYPCGFNTIKMNKGTVKFFNDEKRFGFITPEDGSKDVFVHKNGTKNRITEGDQVEYELEDGPKGPSAVNVTVI